jgi:hypothetical protein
MFSEIFYTFLITSGVGLIASIAKYCYHSKCKRIECLCLKILRDTHAEEAIDELVINHQPQPQVMDRTGTQVLN